jgi:proline dehydrogenase
MQAAYQDSLLHGYQFAVKIVRGAYMEKERARAEKLQYRSPIHISKEAVDKDYNEAIDFLIHHHTNSSVIVASHNENSTLKAVQLSNQENAQHALHFSQLYGMSDHLTFNLASDGYQVSKYLPFGPVEEVIPYLLRRAQENSSVAGQTSRELSLIREECKRRGI